MFDKAAPPFFLCQNVTVSDPFIGECVLFFCCQVLYLRCLLSWRLCFFCVVCRFLWEFKSLMLLANRIWESCFDAFGKLEIVQVQESIPVEHHIWSEEGVNFFESDRLHSSFSIAGEPQQRLISHVHPWGKDVILGKLSLKEHHNVNVFISDI